VLWGLQIVLFFTVGMAALLALTPQHGGSGPPPMVMWLIGLGVGLLYGVLIVAMTLVQAPVYAIIGIMTSGALGHGALVLTKKATQGLEQTIRAVAYANAGHVYWGVPIVGWLVAIVWVPVLEVIGIRETHKCSTGAAVFAVLSWRIVILGALLTLYLALTAIVLGTTAFR